MYGMLKVMYVHDSKTPRSVPKLAIKTLVVMAVLAALSALAMRVFGVALTTGAIVGAGAAALAIVAGVAAWKRGRERRQLMEMRDSALW